MTSVLGNLQWAASAGSLALGLTACGMWPLGDESLESSPEFVPKATLQQIEASRLTAEEVVALLGEPWARRDDPPAIAYQHCYQWTADAVPVVFMIPIPVKQSEGFQDCQRIGIWFDEDGRAFKTKSSTGTQWTCRVEDWLARPGGAICW